MIKNKRRETILEKEFKFLIQELKDSGLKVNENFEEQNDKIALKITLLKKRRIQ